MNETILTMKLENAAKTRAINVELSVKAWDVDELQVFQTVTTHNGSVETRDCGVYESNAAIWHAVPHMLLTNIHEHLTNAYEDYAEYAEVKKLIALAEKSR